MRLTELPIHSPLLIKNIEKLNFSEATQIQEKVIPLAVKGKDISGLSQTGTGKTHAFLIPTIDQLLENPKKQRALCLTPTRELALQIEEEAEKLKKGTSIQTTCLIGGIPMEEQQKTLSDSKLLIATPGRLIDHIKSKYFDPREVDILIFDEADRMFDMGFIDDMKFILQKVPSNRQILLFSATMNFSVLNLIYNFDSNPIEINISKDNLTVDKIKQVIYQVSDEEKDRALIHLCEKNNEARAIVFVNYKDKVDWIVKLLNQNGISATGISSLLRQPKRNQIIKDFSEKKFSVLVATDVASRGLDIDDINLVINYHLPEEHVNYVHRIGRTARAGKGGAAISIASSRDGYNQMKIERYLGNKIPVEWLKEEELGKEISLPRRLLRKEREMSKTGKRTPRKAPSRFNQRSSSSQSSSAHSADKKRRISTTSKTPHLRTEGPQKRRSYRTQVKKNILGLPLPIQL